MITIIASIMFATHMKTRSKALIEWWNAISNISAASASQTLSSLVASVAVPPLVREKYACTSMRMCQVPSRRLPLLFMTHLCRPLEQIIIIRGAHRLIGMTAWFSIG